MSILRLWIDQDWPEKHADLPWWLFEKGGQPLREGRSDPRHWPKGERPEAVQDCELILSGDQGSLVNVRLPAGKLRPEVVAYALEEQLLEAPENYHLHVVARADTESPSQVAAIPRRRLDYLCEALGDLGYRVVAIRLAAQLLPAGDDPAIAFCPDGSGVLQSGQGSLAIMQLTGAAIPWEVEHALAAFPASGIRILSPDSHRIGNYAWLGKLGAAARVEIADIALLSPPPAAADANLCSGPYATGPSGGMAGFKRWRGIALVGAALLIGLVLADWGWRSWQLRQLRQARDALFVATWPQAGPPVAPILQAKRQVDAARHAQGLPGHADLLTLLDALAGIPELRLGKTLRYAEGRLEAEIIVRDQASLARIPAQLLGKGIEARLSAGENTAGGIGARITLQP